MNCVSCQKCCKWGHAVLCDEDILEISNFLEMSVNEFIDTYIDGKILLEFGVYAIHSEPNKAGCIFISRDGCLIYPVRPKKCVQFPRKEHIDEELLGICQLANHKHYE
jgi:uncharacterized protein